MLQPSFLKVETAPSTEDLLCARLEALAPQLPYIGCLCPGPSRPHQLPLRACLQPSPRAVLPAPGDFDSEGHVTKPGVILHCLGEGCYPHRMDGGRGCHQHPTRHRAASQPRLMQPWMSARQGQDLGQEVTSKRLPSTRRLLSPGTLQASLSSCSSATETTHGPPGPHLSPAPPELASGL